MFSSFIPSDLRPSSTTKSNAPKPPGIKLTNPDNAAIMKIPIKFIKEISIPTINAEKYKTTAAANHSTQETNVQYTPIYRLFVSAGFTIV